MNKIFKIIWNATTQTWVVVSELTRAHTKRASATVATAVLATVLSATVQASTGSSGGVIPIHQMINLTLTVVLLLMIIINSVLLF